MKQKIKIQIKGIKPRNTLVPLLFSLNSGSHEKPHKSLRKEGKTNLKKNLNSLLKDEI